MMQVLAWQTVEGFAKVEPRRCSGSTIQQANKRLLQCFDAVGLQDHNRVRGLDYRLSRRLPEPNIRLLNIMLKLYDSK